MDDDGPIDELAVRRRAKQERVNERDCFAGPSFREGMRRADAFVDAFMKDLRAAQKPPDHA